jgi:hypothetical protein
MGAAVFVLSDSIDEPAAALAHRIVMAPVIAIGAANQRAMGVGPGQKIAAGQPLAFRDPLDPPAALLEGGLPKATGARAAWDPKDGVERLLQSAAWAASH